MVLQPYSREIRPGNLVPPHRREEIPAKLFANRELQHVQCNCLSAGNETPSP